MAEFKSFKALDKYLLRAVKSAIKEEPPKAVKNLMKKHILHDVYMVYKPVMYERRYKDHGLMDENNIKIHNRRNEQRQASVEIFNITKRNRFYSNLYLAPLIEFGHTGAIERGYVGYPRSKPFRKYHKKRPFIDNTRKSLKKSKSHIKAFQYSLSKYGIKTNRSKG
jgi:hypothetical protein